MYGEEKKKEFFACLFYYLCGFIIVCYACFIAVIWCYVLNCKHCIYLCVCFIFIFTLFN